jgi:hypothetical protein
MEGTVPVVVADRQVRPEPRRKREGASRHPERLEDVLLHVAPEGHPGDPLDEESRQGQAMVGVAVDVARPKDPVRHAVGEILSQRTQSLGSACRHPEDALVETRRMGQKMSRCDRLLEGCGELELLEVGVDVLTQIQLSRLDELENRRSREQLGDRAHTKKRLLGIDGAARLHVREAVALGQEGLPVLNHHEHETWGVVTVHLGREEPVQEALDLVRLARRCGARAGQRGGTQAGEGHDRIQGRDPPRSLLLHVGSPQGICRFRPLGPIR